MMSDLSMDEPDRSVENAGTAAPIMIDVVVYQSQNDPDRVLTQAWREYCGVIERPSDGITCLAIRAPGGARRQFIEVGSIYSVSVESRGGIRILQVPPQRWMLRAEEIAAFIEGRDVEPWAVEYFSPDGAKYFKNDPDYEGEMEKWLAPFNNPEKTKRNTSGCLVVFLFPLALAIGCAGWAFSYV